MLDAARIAFGQSGFDHVGVRLIAARADTDASIVIRLFGSKEALFQIVASDAFAMEAPFDAPLEEIGRAVADYLLGTAHSPLQQEEFDAFLFLLRSATSAVGGPIVSRALHSAFIQPLAAHFCNEEAEGRAALVTACVLGFATMRFALNTPALQPAKAGALRMPLAEAIQACVGSGL